MGIKCLPAMRVSTDLFEKLLKTYDAYVESVPDLNIYKSGYPDKEKIKRCNNELISQVYRVCFVCGEYFIPIGTAWKQYIVRCDGGLPLNTYVLKDVTGPEAEKYIERVVLKKYSKEEYDAILKGVCVEYDENLAQQHFLNAVFGKVEKFTNCYYYDINNAHGSAILELFPRCEEELLRMYEHRKDNDGYYKKVFNYYWGQLGAGKKQKDGTVKYGPYRGAYNWVVQRTTKLITEFLEKVGGEIVYINTDGIIVSNPRNPQPSSNKLGEFKLETGTVYTYRHPIGDKSVTPYELLQFMGDDGVVSKKGSLPLIFRDAVDLSSNKGIKFKRVKVNNHYEYQNMEEIIL